jgi:hypothetical protein
VRSYLKNIRFLVIRVEPKLHCIIASRAPILHKNGLKLQSRAMDNQQLPIAPVPIASSESRVIGCPSAIAYLNSIFRNPRTQTPHCRRTTLGYKAFGAITWMPLLRYEESSGFVGPQPLVEFRCGVAASVDRDDRVLWSLGTLCCVQVRRCCMTPGRRSNCNPSQN